MDKTNAYKDQRREELGRLLEAALTGEADGYGDYLEALCTFVEHEVEAAFKRGVTVKQRTSGVVERARQTSDGRPLRYPSAVQAGLMRRVES